MNVDGLIQMMNTNFRMTPEFKKYNWTCASSLSVIKYWRYKPIGGGPITEPLSPFD